jgi:hypothetical protein
MRLRNPLKLGDDSASWLRHDVRCRECVAKTWRYFVSLIREVRVVPLVLCSLVCFLPWTGSFGDMSTTVAMEVLVNVEVDVAMAAIACVCLAQFPCLPRRVFGSNWGICEGRVNAWVE